VPRLGSFVVQHRRPVLLCWLVLLVAGVLGGGQVFSRLADVAGPSSAESVQGWERLSDAATTGPRVLAVLDDVDPADPAVRSAVTAAVQDLGGLSGVAAAQDPYGPAAQALTATDGRALLLVVDLDSGLPDARQDAVLDSVVERLRKVQPGSVTVGGGLLLNREINEAVERDLARGELISLPLALLLMLVVFGGLVAASLPIVAAICTIAGALLALLGATYVLDLSADIVSVVTVLGLGLAIDYGLLIVSRFREERAAGAQVPDAVLLTCASAGRTVAFSGVTVAASLSGLLVFDDPTYRSIGAAGVAVVLVAVASALTLTPALLALLGRRLSVPQPVVEDDGRFARLARRVQRRPLLVAAAVAALLAALAVPFLGVRFVEGGPQLIPKSFETRQVADAVSTRFAGQEAEPVRVVTDLAPDSPELTAWTADVAELAGVREVRDPQPLADGVTSVEVVPGGVSQGDGAQDLVRALRADRPSPDTLVTGSAAYLLDSQRATAERLPWAVSLVVLATFVLLFLMTGSVLVPLKALIMNVLSLGASFGALVLVFQDGWLAGPLGVEPAEGLQTWVPVIVFVFAFGLSMDYEVFLLSRIKELVDQGHDNDTAVAIGLQRSGRIITCAALLLIIVFAGFAAGQMAAITQLGLAMAVAIAVDATLVRCLLVPATMTLLGDRNWWAPPALRRLHQRIGVSEHAPPRLPSPRAAPSDRAGTPR